jgi:hypothetical protein
MLRVKVAEEEVHSMAETRGSGRVLGPRLFGAECW